MWYPLALFLHVLGAISLFVAVGLIVAAFLRMRRATTLVQVREWATVVNIAGKSIVFLALVILVPALYMVIVAWGFATPWVIVALIAFVLLAIMGATVNDKAILRVFTATRDVPDGPVPAELHAYLLSPQLWLAESVRLLLLIGVLALMTIKPDMLFSVLILVGMLLLGLVLGLVMQRKPGLSGIENARTN